MNQTKKEKKNLKNLEPNLAECNNFFRTKISWYFFVTGKRKERERQKKEDREKNLKRWQWERETLLEKKKKNI